MITLEGILDTLSHMLSRQPLVSLDHLFEIDFQTFFLLSTHITGTFDTSDVEAAEAWGKLWPESLSGSGAGTKTNALLRVLPVVESLVRSLLMDLSWTRRKQGVQVTLPPFPHPLF